RAACAHLRTFVNGRGSTPEAVARSMFPGDVVVPEILRGATAAATTTTSNWAQPLAQQSVRDLVAAITSLSAGADVLTRGLQLQFDHLAQMRVPGKAFSSDDGGSWIIEGQPIPARSLNFTSGALLEPKKLAVLVNFSREIVEAAAIEEMSRALISEAAAIALDGALFGTQGSGASPAGLLYNVPALTPASGGGMAALIDDIKNLVGALAIANGGR